MTKEAAHKAARMQNSVRVLRDRARLREESFRTGEVENLLVVGRERGEILGVVRGERRPTLYPRWQFGADGEIPAELPQVECFHCIRLVDTRARDRIAPARLYL